MLTVHLSFSCSGKVRKPGQFWAKQVLTLCGSDAISEGSLNFGGLVVAPFGIACGLSLFYYHVF